jgi:hypothetical protein
MTTQTPTSELGSHDHAVGPDYNKMTTDAFEMISHDHLIEVQLDFLVRHLASTVFGDQRYMDEWKVELSSLLRNQINPTDGAGEWCTQQEILEVLSKPETLKTLQLYVKNFLEKMKEHFEVIPIIDDLILEMREDQEDQRRRPTAPA